jgi:hypothetical protein
MEVFSKFFPVSENRTKFLFLALYVCKWEEMGHSFRKFGAEKLAYFEKLKASAEEIFGNNLSC